MIETKPVIVSQLIDRFGRAIEAVTRATRAVAGAFLRLDGLEIEAGRGAFHWEIMGLAALASKATLAPQLRLCRFTPKLEREEGPLWVRWRRR